MTSWSGRRWIRPGLWTTLAAGAVFIVLIGLGTWQLQRLEWKRSLQDEIDRGLAAPPVAELPGPDADPADWNYRRVQVTGRFLHASEIHLVGRSFERRAGIEIVTPLIASRPALGGPLMVHRGWVPIDKAAAASRPETLPEGEVTVTGILLAPPGKQAWLRPDNEPAANQWYWIDLPAMGWAAGYPEGVPGTLLYAERAADPAALPAGGRLETRLRNDHLQYAVTWYALALVLAVIFLLFHYRPVERESKPV